MSFYGSYFWLLLACLSSPDVEFLRIRAKLLNILSEVVEALFIQDLYIHLQSFMIYPPSPTQTLAV